jgi:hypothetical protein
LIDMAAQGLTCQVLAHKRGEDGRCLLGAFTKRADEVPYEDRVASRTGLRPERFVDEYTTPITDADVAAAPPEHQASLEAARQAGGLVCGYVNATAMTEAGSGSDFAAAAPFTGGLTGARAAALTIRNMMGDEVASGHQWRFSFLSARSLVGTLRCDPHCACAASNAA